ncbi:MAG: LuxR C-terminal-related transcriptional regulator, partial [Actinoplanes sp.]
SLAAYHGGLGTEAIEARQAALALREELGETLRIGENLRWVSRLHWWTGRPEEARAVAYRAVAVLEAEPPGRELAAAYSNLSQLFMLGDDQAAAIAWGERATDLAVRLGDVATEVHAMVNIGSARMHQGNRAGYAELRRAHDRAVTAGLDDDAGRALTNLASTAVDQYDFDVAESTLDRIMPFLAARDLDGYTRHLLGHRARLRLHRGDWAGARDDAVQALAGSPQPSVGYVPALAVRSLLRSRLGEEGGLEDAELAASYGYPTGEMQWVCPAAVALAEAHYLAGEVDRAAAEAAHGLDVAVRAGHTWLAGELAFQLWRCGGLTTAPDLVATPFKLVIEGEWRAAAAEWERRECPYAQAEALSSGDGAAVAEALRIFDRLGAVRAARRLRAVSRERGLRVPRGPRPSTAADPTGLTGRQLEVLKLLADGLSNAEIAGRLTVSVKTVDHHVSAVLSKLRVPNRGQAASAAFKRGLI